MPPHLHPRSNATTSLFTITLLASFFIVGMPHLFPCPAPRKVFMDSEISMTPDGQPQPQRIRRRRRKAVEESSDSDATSTAAGLSVDSTRELAEEAAEFRHMEEEAKRLAKMNRECPIPKPGGVIGSILGFDHNQTRGGKETWVPSTDRNGDL